MHPILVILGSSAYCYFVVTKIPKGISRVISLLPIFYLFSILPWQFSSAFARGISSFFITWIASFKLLLFSFDRGPLLSIQNYLDFLLLAVFPFKIKDKYQNNNINSPSPVINNNPPLGRFISLIKKLVPTIIILPILLLVFYIISIMYVENAYNIIIISPKLVTVLYGLTTLAWFHVALTHCLPRYELVPLFNHPYLATSLKDFWGRRWNRLSSDILRQTVYDPTRECLADTMGPGPAKTAAMITTLAVSGIMHEMKFYYITCGSKPTWEMTLFFVLQGLCMAVEAGVKRLARLKGWAPLPPAVSILLTVGFVTVTCYWMLVLPVWRSTQEECRFR